MPITMPTAPTGFNFAGQTFQLSAAESGAFAEHYNFKEPVTITLHYLDADVVGVNKSKLELDYWNGSAWVDAACGAYDWHPAENWVAVPICHLSQFALFGPPLLKLYVPLVKH